MTAAAGAAAHGAAHGSMGHGEGRGTPVLEKTASLIDDEWIDVG